MATSKVVVTHIGEDYSTLNIHISVPGSPGQSFEIETEREVGEALHKAGLSYISDEEDTENGA